MPIVLISPEFTQEQYEETNRKLTGGKNRMESPADWPVEGLLAHIAGQGESTFRVVDVWESEEAFQRFGEVIGPILQEVGMPGQPQLFPLHNFVK